MQAQAIVQAVISMHAPVADVTLPLAAKCSILFSVVKTSAAL